MTAILATYLYVAIHTAWLPACLAIAAGICGRAAGGAR